MKINSNLVKFSVLHIILQILGFLNNTQNSKLPENVEH
jgi:hypothetical protein